MFDLSSHLSTGDLLYLLHISRYQNRSCSGRTFSGKSVQMTEYRKKNCLATDERRKTAPFTAWTYAEYAPFLVLMPPNSPLPLPCEMVRLLPIDELCLWISCIPAVDDSMIG